MKKKKLKNKFEQRIDRQLKKSGLAYKYEGEKLPYYFTGHYLPDFVIYLSGNRKIYIEAKGYFRPEHKRKMAAVKKLHPLLDIRIIFYAKKARDIKWAEKYGFPYSIDNIPKEWLE